MSGSDPTRGVAGVAAAHAARVRGARARGGGGVVGAVRGRAAPAHARAHAGGAAGGRQAARRAARGAAAVRQEELSGPLFTHSFYIHCHLE